MSMHCHQRVTKRVSLQICILVAAATGGTGDYKCNDRPYVSHLLKAEEDYLQGHVLLQQHLDPPRQRPTQSQITCTSMTDDEAGH